METQNTAQYAELCKMVLKNYLELFENPLVSAETWQVLLKTLIITINGVNQDCYDLLLEVSFFLSQIT